MSEWITYEREWSGKTSRITKLSIEIPPRTGGWRPRPATDEEIANESTFRSERDAAAKAEAEFKARPDYQDAKAISQLLDWISPVDHPLDRLTPAEWSELRKRLEAPHD